MFASGPKQYSIHILSSCPITACLFVNQSLFFSIDGEPGFSQQTLGFLKQKVDSEEAPVIVTLLIDEMSLHQHLEFDGCNVAVAQGYQYHQYI